MWINCISSKNIEESRTIYSSSNNIEILMVSGTDDIIDKLFESLLQRFQDERKTSNNRGSEFIPKNVGLLHYIFLKISLKKDKSHIKSPGWLKKKEQQ